MWFIYNLYEKMRKQTNKKVRMYTIWNYLWRFELRNEIYLIRGIKNMIWNGRVELGDVNLIINDRV